MSIIHMDIQFVAGTTIDYAIETALKLAKDYHCSVSFRFNGDTIDVAPLDTFEEVYNRWDALRKSKSIWKYEDTHIL